MNDPKNYYTKQVIYPWYYKVYDEKGLLTYKKAMDYLNNYQRQDVNFLEYLEKQFKGEKKND